MAAVRYLYLPSEFTVIIKNALELSMFKIYIGSSQIDCKASLHIPNDVFCYALTITILQISSFCSRLNTTTIKISFTSLCVIMSLLVLYYDIALHVSAHTAIIMRYNLTNIFILLNCSL
jgi:hypothetical protein